MRSRFHIDRAGFASGAEYIASPNCDERPDGEEPTLVVIHNISLPPGEFGGNGITGLFTNVLDPDAHPSYAGIAGLRVSAHFLIGRDGSLTQFVPCTLRAWHAGVSSWRGRAQCNDFSLGIELEGTDLQPYENAQYATLDALLQALRRRFPTLRECTGHAQIAPGRKTDPGPAFDWSRVQALSPTFTVFPSA